MGEDPHLDVGATVAGRFQIQQLLGQGGRKRTYLARDNKVDRLVAISVVRPEAILSDPEGTEREAKVLGRIGSHPNIVSVIDYETNQDGAAEYIVFQYLGGGTLGEYLQQAGPLPLDELLQLGQQICRGLAHLHQNGLVHRDVSPDNVWFDERRVAHLGDFDSAIAVASGDDLRPITTASFAAPEESEGWAVDERTDLFSLGGVLLCAATGDRRPGPVSELSRRRPELPSAFCDLIADLLAESPDQRPPSAESVLERLEDIRQTSDIETLIAAGESGTVEFKSSLHHPYQLHEGQVEKIVRRRLNWEVTKTIAAFLNTDGGTLLIGIGDHGEVLGIEPDFAYVQNRNADGWLLSLRTLAINALGPDIWNIVRVSLVRRGGKTVAVIRCPRRDSETWHREDSTERFYYRASNSTQELSGSAVLRYVREHWPARES